MTQTSAKLLWLGFHCFTFVIAMGCMEVNVTESALNPQGDTEAYIIERRGFDRNFELRLRRKTTKKEEMIFLSPDEGRPPGTERLIWSVDGRYLLLVGERFSTAGETKLSSGEDIYLLYDSGSGEIKCNAGQTNMTRFTLSDLAGIEFKAF